MYGFLIGICLGIVLHLMGYPVFDAQQQFILPNLVIYLFCLGIYFLSVASILRGFIKTLERLERNKKENKDYYWELNDNE